MKSMSSRVRDRVGHSEISLARLQPLAQPRMQRVEHRMVIQHRQRARAVLRRRRPHDAAVVQQRRRAAPGSPRGTHPSSRASCPPDRCSAPASPARPTGTASRVLSSVVAIGPRFMPEEIALAASARDAPRDTPPPPAPADGAAPCRAVHALARGQQFAHRRALARRQRREIRRQMQPLRPLQHRLRLRGAPRRRDACGGRTRVTVGSGGGGVRRGLRGASGEDKRSGKNQITHGAGLARGVRADQECSDERGNLAWRSHPKLAYGTRSPPTPRLRRTSYSRFASVGWCPEEDSNLHALASAST